MTTSSTLSVIVLTLNEERHLERCLRSVAALQPDLYVVDSGSTDGTERIAKEFGATFVTHPFVDQANQFNWALDTLPLRTSWTLRLDADEYLMTDGIDEIRRALSRVPSDVSGILMRRRAIFRGRWIRHGGYYPTWLLRLFRTGVGRSESTRLNEHIVLSEGRTVRLEAEFINDELQSIAEWSRKHIGYAQRQAEVLHELRSLGPGAVRPRLMGQQTERKRWLLVNLYGRTPLFLRAFGLFFYRYVLRGGFRDGGAGLVFHFLQGCWFPFLTDVMLLDHRRGNEARRSATEAG